jgi:phytol kinase
MISQILITTLFFIGFFCIIYLSEYLHSHFNINPEYTRKLAHSFATLSSLIFLVAIESHWYILILGLFFFLLLLASNRKKLFRSIHGVNRNTAGSYLLPVAVYSVFFISQSTSNSLLFILPILLLGISDPLAGLAGYHYRHRINRITIFKHKLDKTILGSTMFFVSSLVISLITLHLFDYAFPKFVLFSLFIAVVTTVTELLSPYGTDNLTVPLITVLLLCL